MLYDETSRNFNSLKLSACHALSTWFPKLPKWNSKGVKKLTSSFRQIKCQDVKQAIIYFTHKDAETQDYTRETNR